jgi:hypothetical protein
MLRPARQTSAATGPRRLRDREKSSIRNFILNTNLERCIPLFPSLTFLTHKGYIMRKGMYFSIFYTTGELDMVKLTFDSPG